VIQQGTLALASIGLYGIMAYSVNQRVREIGLRMALGAAWKSVLWLILKQGMTLVLAGVSAIHPIGVAGAASVLMAVALGSHVDPLVALREG
jgi:putative ABC transport system permease protein